MGRHRASQPQVQQWARRVLLVALAVAVVVLWSAAFSAAVRYEDSADRVTFPVSSP